jgi:hypothetical protein
MTTICLPFQGARQRIFEKQSSSSDAGKGEKRERDERDDPILSPVPCRLIVHIPSHYLVDPVMEHQA